MRWIAIFALLTTGLSSSLAIEASLSPDIGVSEALLLSEDTGYDPKLQLYTAADAGLGIGIDGIAIGGYIGLHYAGRSSLAGGYSYRGFRGWHGGAYIDYQAPSIGSLVGHSVSPGLRVAGSARFSRYLNTDLIFFYPHVGVSPAITVANPRLPHFYRISMPVDVYFRRDLWYSVSVGLSITVGFDLVKAAVLAIEGGPPVE